ncbi:MAG: hypothetical protein QGG02_07220 [Gammaproteobacteria bacterium]|jgi:hypothetical protein|nr:hypothetical protein [Gammaproteobacteria bacterium]|tara:strand:+ start:522 stop:914 length:393 start_codon:yes stop_codon:yes gene_type:complete
MNRRDFLLCRTEGSHRVAELSCEKMYMHFQDLVSGIQQASPEAGTPDDAEWWAGEPALLLNSLDPESFFRALLDELREIDTVIVKDMEWLAHGDFRIRVDTLLAAFKITGGKVTYQHDSHDIEEEVSTAL